jgi:integrase/recombinase XerD
MEPLAGFDITNILLLFVIRLSGLTIEAFSIVRQEVLMTQERITPLRERMIEDMRIRGIGEKAQAAHIRGVKDFAAFLGRPPDTATPEELRTYQLHMANTGVSPWTFNTRIVSLRFFFGVTCGCEESAGGNENDPVNRFPAKRGSCSSSASHGNYLSY